MSYKGKFSPKNPKKYRCDPTKIIYRSLCELKAMKSFDDNVNILEWCSEEFAIPYISPIDKRYHRYFPDFVIRMKLPNGDIKTMMLEVKPKAQTTEPKRQTKKTRRYITEVTTWGVNQSKWEAAREYCLDKGWEFRLITEIELGIK
jgi:hypothetical protein